MVRLADVLAIRQVRDLVDEFSYAFAVSIEELQILANTSYPGGNQYTIEESNEAWSGKLGQYLISDLDSTEYCHSYHALQHIYGNMARHYSGCVQHRGCMGAWRRLANVKLPCYKIVLSNSSSSTNRKATRNFILLLRRQGVIKSAASEYEADLVARPPYYTPAHEVTKIIRMTDSQYHCYVTNTKRGETALSQLQQWSAQIKAANIEKRRLRQMPGVHARIFLGTLCDLQWHDMCDDGHVSSGMFVCDLRCIKP